jgi:hypothetical protein
MTLDPGASAAGELRSHLATSLSGDPAWDLALSRLARGEVALHLAVLTEPFGSLLLDGAKTIESRFSRVRCAPYGTLAEGDIVVKKTGGPVTGIFQAGTVRSYHLTPARVAQLRDQYAAQICARNNQFWADRADCAYATLVDVIHVRLLPAQAFPKKDRRGWVQLTRPTRQEMLL